MKNGLRVVAVAAAMSILTRGISAFAAEAEPATIDDAKELAEKLDNPISSLISVPIQYNYDEKFGVNDDGKLNVLNIQPVIPFRLNDDWNLITRTIVPLIDANDVPTGTSKSGIGDTLHSDFFSPSKIGANGVIWGVGPVFLLPTATDDLLGGKKWGAGPTFVALRQKNGWTVGMLANHVWSFAGDDDRPDVNNTYAEPWIGYTTESAWTFEVSTELNYDWETHQWQIMPNSNISKLVMFGKRPVNFGAGVHYWAQSSEEGPEGFGARANVTFLLPKASQ